MLSHACIRAQVFIMSALLKVWVIPSKREAERKNTAVFSCSADFGQLGTAGMELKVQSRAAQQQQ